MSGSVLSVNVAEIREIPHNGEMVPTGIWKVPVEARVAVRGVNVEGDEQADRAVHGGVDKALYAYACEDTDWWERELGRELPHGVFGENLTLRGVDVTGAEIGERWRIGSVLLEVSEPRFPCWKLGARFVLAAGDGVEVVTRPGHGLTIGAFAHAFLEDRGELPRLLEVPAVSRAWRDWVRERAA